MAAMQHEESFWLDATLDKREHGDLCAALERRARSGRPMPGFQLKGAELNGVNLVNHGGHHGFILHKADLYRANLQNAHLFALDLRGSSLMKADLRHANLHCADLRDCNLLGVRLDGARLDNVIWDRQLLQERKGRELAQRGNLAAALQLFQEAEETYRNLRLHLERAGLFEQAGLFFHREMVVRRLQLPRYSGRRLLSWLVDLFSGYGEKPLNVVLFSLGLIGLCGLLYFLVGVEQGDQRLGLDLGHGLLANLMDLLGCLYFSVVTFTTLGYGDISPHGLARPLAAFEAFVGSFTMALFVVVFVKKMTR
ncbi:pentapeptide repeat-containing protein [Pseudomonas lalucatii]|uniref:Pentapeptide repeat-containing protein n=1 Tax=Pseudomonas lalucatii TaxID=1424203 RepID=A0ABS5Q6L6_9PSED|nr:ion channel [Pseudomonas lalucatii]MBS7664243.1 pentapeptide repeat-containing protein [Pseudomonas lalucatii]MBS7690944.1 pentapeptide repeat-containing protein [Pseudomonas lalucatii]MBS7725510.1 pentapeptide repeat-containing protein [Pseudomonas lalucatii]QVM86549.1 pentapeptide repeat-containing protein [Pseudomonas lalucatii]